MKNCASPYSYAISEFRTQTVPADPFTLERISI